ncbi:hypothetical protein ACOSQ4_009720 [Xanthoceras sorbifolium]
MGPSVNKSRGGRNFRGDPIEVDSGKENFNPNTSGFGGARVERRNSILVHQCLRVIEEVRNPSLFHLWNELIVGFPQTKASDVFFYGKMVEVISSDLCSIPNSKKPHVCSKKTEEADERANPVVVTDDTSISSTVTSFESIFSKVSLVISMS